MNGRSARFNPSRLDDAALETAAARHEEATGERMDPRTVDPRRPELRGTYAAFARAALRIPYRSALCEELALRRGLKPVLRLLTAPASAGALATRFERAGFATRSSSPVCRESGVDGTTSTGSGDGEARVLFYAGADAHEVQEAARLDERMIVETGVAEAEMEQMTRRLGRLLGYPSCCVEEFCAAGPDRRNVRVIRAAAERTSWFDPLLNNVSLSVCHLVPWFPCRYDCEPSLQVARSMSSALASDRTGGIGTLRRYLEMPRLYLDDRRQVILDGEAVSPNRVRYRSVHSPYAFDRRTADAAVEWVFFASTIAPLLEGEELTIEEELLVVRRAGRPSRALRRPPGSVWLPFRRPPR